MNNVEGLFVSPTTTLRLVLESINTSGRGIALVIDEQRHLLGVITDGDARRAILSGADLSVSAQHVLSLKPISRGPIVSKIDTPSHDLVELVRKTGVSHIPLLNAEGQVVNLVGLDDLLRQEELELQAVVMAGGKGTRLYPLTQDLPKPMLPVGDRPLMERIIQQLSEAGIRHVNVTTHYLAEKITDYFGDGSRFGVSLKYVPEERLLGTAGGLSLMPPPDTPLLVINGDILTKVDFRAMLAFHKEHHAALTLAVRLYEYQVPYGVIESDGALVRRVVEKPTYKYFVNAGIYLLEPDVHHLIPSGEKFDMTDLIQVLLEQGRTVVNFPVWEYWRDIGQRSDYDQAQADVKNGTLSV